MRSDPVVFYGESFTSRFMLGTALYPSPAIMQSAIDSADTDIITLSLRRQSPQQGGGNDFWDNIKQLNKQLLPNTAGCHSAKEAITIAHMARELFNTDWIKLEVIGSDYNLQPDPYETVKAADELIKAGFKVFPYCTDDLIFCQKLVEVGCQVIMPWGAPIGTGKGLLNLYAIETIRSFFSDITMVIDAGIGSPSQAAKAMELGVDALLMNTAVAKAIDPIMMAAAFKQAIQAGRLAYLAGLMGEQPRAKASSPIVGMPFWHQES